MRTLFTAIHRKSHASDTSSVQYPCADAYIVFIFRPRQRVILLFRIRHARDYMISTEYHAQYQPIPSITGPVINNHLSRWIALFREPPITRRRPDISYSSAALIPSGSYNSTIFHFLFRVRYNVVGGGCVIACPAGGGKPALTIRSGSRTV